MAQDLPVRVLLRSFVELWLGVSAARGVAHDNDPISTYVFEVLACANTAHLAYAAPESAWLTGPGPARDKLGLLRPISGNAVAQSLSLPYETVRVRLQKMIADGRVLRVQGGLLAAANLDDAGPVAATRPRAHRAILDSLRDLKAIGYDFSAHREASRVGEPPPPGLVVRVMSSMINRVLELQAPAFGGLVNMTIWSGVARANVRKLMRDPVASWRYASPDSPPPNEARQPISVRALAAELDLPFETTRRHVASMTDRGWLATVPGQGVIGPVAVVSGDGLGRVHPDIPGLYARALTNLWRIGFDFEAL